MERYPQIRAGMTEASIAMLLGPPTRRHAREAEFEEVEDQEWNSGRTILPRRFEWVQWIDPVQPDRWVAISYMKWTDVPNVYIKLKKGF